jgi:hypothetical protein
MRTHTRSLHGGATGFRKVGWTVLTCDYNGWNDAPEDEREWFDQHPEIWGGATREADGRPLRVTLFLWRRAVAGR